MSFNIHVLIPSRKWNDDNYPNDNHIFWMGWNYWLEGEIILDRTKWWNWNTGFHEEKRLFSRSNHKQSEITQTFLNYTCGLQHVHKFHQPNLDTPTNVRIWVLERHSYSWTAVGIWGKILCSENRTGTYRYWIWTIYETSISACFRCLKSFRAHVFSENGG